jgi:hypothetical protein
MRVSLKYLSADYLGFLGGISRVNFFIPNQKR